MSAHAGADDPAVIKAQDALVARQYSDEDRAVLLRFVRLAPDDEFRLAAVEVRAPSDRRALLGWLKRSMPQRHFHEVSLRSLPGSSVHEELRDHLAALSPRPAGLVLVLTDLEGTQEGTVGETPRLFAQLNVQRDLLVRDLKVPILLCSTSAALLKLRIAAPDFCDFFRTIVRTEAVAAEPMVSSPAMSGSSVTIGAQSLAEPDWPPLLQEADQAIIRWEFDHALDLIAKHRLIVDMREWELEVGLLEAEINGAREGLAAGLSACERLRTMPIAADRPVTQAKILGQLAGYAVAEGRFDDAERFWTEAEALLQKVGSDSATWRFAIPRARAALVQGRVDEARVVAEGALERARFEGRKRVELEALSVIADLDVRRGDYTRAEATLRERVLPLADQLDDARARARAFARIASVIQTRGEIDEVLRIRREEELPVYDRLGDARSRAATLGQIATTLHARGEVDEALRIRREEELPIYERLGLARETAHTNLQIANILLDRHQIEACADLLKGRVLPVLERLRDEAWRATALGVLGVSERELGHSAEALRVFSEARDLAERIGHTALQLDARLSAAQTWWLIGNIHGALRELYAAIDLACEVGEPSFVIRVIEQLVPALLADGRLTDARRELDRAKDLLIAQDRWSLLSTLDALEAEIDFAKTAKREQRRKRPKRH